MELENATFIAEMEEGAPADEETLREVVESWEGYNYKVGQLEVVS